MDRNAPPPGSEKACPKISGKDLTSSGLSNEAADRTASFHRRNSESRSRSLTGELALLAQYAQGENTEERAREQDEKAEDSDESPARAPEGARPGWTAKRRIRHSVTHCLE
jgi:mevalonate pyrophosphate decarboxylase